jgi:hypothetical protein
MAIAKNVAKGEGIGRIILGVLLIVWGFSVSGFWQPVFIVVGASLLITAFVGY